jgi:hypothetical protein
MHVSSTEPPSLFLVKPHRHVFPITLCSLQLVFLFCWTYVATPFPAFHLISPVLPLCYCTVMLSDLLISAVGWASFFARALSFFKLGSAVLLCASVSFYYAALFRKPINFPNLYNSVHIMFDSLYKCAIPLKTLACLYLRTIQHGLHAPHLQFGLLQGSSNYAFSFCHFHSFINMTLVIW